MHRVRSPAGVAVSYDRYGKGPPLVLVHGAFSDHATNWEFVKPLLEDRFTMYAIARRGRGDTDATTGHSLDDESADVAAVLQTIVEPAFLLGHSYGAQCALAAARKVPNRVRKLVLYEPPWPNTLRKDDLDRLEKIASGGDWDDFATTFFRDLLRVPADALAELRSSPLWPPIVADGAASLGDLRAIIGYDFNPERFRNLNFPVLLQVGTESPPNIYATDALAAVLPDVRIEELAGQAHEGMTTAPEMYAEAVSRFLLPAGGRSS